MNSYSNYSLTEAYLDVYRNLNMQEEFKDLTPEKEERVRGRHAQLGSDIIQNDSEIKRLGNKPFSKFRPGVKRKKSELIKQLKQKYKLFQNASDALIRTSASRSAKLTKKIEDIKHQLPKNKIIRFQREDYEYLISYLINEGYVDDVKSADAILYSMSDQWLNGILNESDSLADLFDKSNQLMKDDLENRKSALERIRKMKELIANSSYSSESDVNSTTQSKPKPNSTENLTPHERILRMKELINKGLETMDKQDKTK